jgi:hypothetical protein
MPRSLPWLTNTKIKTESPLANEDSASPTPRARRASPPPPRTPRRNENANNKNENETLAPWETPRHIDVLRSCKTTAYVFYCNIIITD